MLIKFRLVLKYKEMCRGGQSVRNTICFEQAMGKL